MQSSSSCIVFLFEATAGCKSGFSMTVERSAASILLEFVKLCKFASNDFLWQNTFQKIGPLINLFLLGCYRYKHV